MWKVINNWKNFRSYTLKDLSEIEWVNYQTLAHRARAGKLVQVFSKKSLWKKWVITVARYLDSKTSEKLIRMDKIEGLF